MREEVRQALEKYDLLMTPSAGTTAARIQDDPIISSKGSALTQPSLYGRIFNLTGTPAISIPCGFDSRGLPIGLQIGGRLDGATTVLKLAHASEQSLRRTLVATVPLMVDAVAHDKASARVIHTPARFDSNVARCYTAPCYVRCLDS